MIQLGPLIGCIRRNVVTIGYEVSEICNIHIYLYDENDTCIYHEMNQSYPGKMCISHLSGVYTGYYTVKIVTSSQQCIGSFKIGDEITVVSCNNSSVMTKLWNRMSISPPSICLHIGDNIYMDNGMPTFDIAMKIASSSHWNDIVEIFRQAYRDHWSTPHMKKILSSCSNIFIWDDHDVCDSWDQDITLPSHWQDMSWEEIAGSFSDIKSKVIVAAIQVYCEYQLPLSLGKAEYIPGSFSLQIQDKHVLFLDRRFSRISGMKIVPDSYTYKPEIIISCVPIFFLHPLFCNNITEWITSTFLNLRDLYDHWILQPDDIHEIIHLFKENTILLSGDVHMCGDTSISMNINGRDMHISQYTSSAISSKSPPLIFQLLLQICNRYTLSIHENNISVQHNSWIRDNGYIQFNIQDIRGSREYIFSSLLN